MFGLYYFKYRIEMRLNTTSAFTITLLSVFLLISCDFINEHYGGAKKVNKKQEIKNGVLRSYWGNKNLKSEVTYVNDTVNGFFKEYYENGNIKKEAYLEKGRKHGAYKLYYIDGGVHHETNYVSGLKEGMYRQFYENGKVYKEVTYVNNLKQGEEIKYHKNGAIKSKLVFKDNFPGKGLVEYNTKGKQLTKKPKLKIRMIDNLKVNGRYRLEVSFEGKNKKSNEFYFGKLTDGKYLNDGLSEIKLLNGKGVIEGTVPPNQFHIEKMNIIGSYKTLYGNRYITSRRYDLILDSTF